MYNVERKMEITKEQAREFYRDLCGKVYGGVRKCGGGIMSEGLIADHMEMTIERVTRMLTACLKFGIMGRASGMWVV